MLHLFNRPRLFKSFSGPQTYLHGGVVWSPPCHAVEAWWSTLPGPQSEHRVARCSQGFSLLCFCCDACMFLQGFLQIKGDLFLPFIEGPQAVVGTGPKWSEVVRSKGVDTRLPFRDVWQILAHTIDIYWPHSVKYQYTIQISTHDNVTFTDCILRYKLYIYIYI